MVIHPPYNLPALLRTVGYPVEAANKQKDSQLELEQNF